MFIYSFIYLLIYLFVYSYICFIYDVSLCSMCQLAHPTISQQKLPNVRHPDPTRWRSGGPHMAFSNARHSKSIYSYCWSKIVDFSCLTTKKSKGWPGWQWYPHNCWWLPFPFGRILLEHTATVKSCASLVQWKQCLDILQQLKEEEQCLENLWLLMMGRNRLTYVLRMLLAQSGQKKNLTCTQL